MPRESHLTSPLEATESNLPERISAEKDSARSFHEVTTEWLELSREYKKLANAPWHVEKRRPDKVPTDSFADRIKAIEHGNSADLLGAWNFLLPRAFLNWFVLSVNYQRR